MSQLGVLHQALRDLSLWIEKGLVPPATTTFKVVNGQVKVPTRVVDRMGILPLINLTVNGGKRAEAKLDEPVTFAATIEVPPTTKKSDIGGMGHRGNWHVSRGWKICGDWRSGLPDDGETTSIFTSSEAYFPTLRATS